MKAQIRIPNGWHKLCKGGLIMPGDRCLLDGNWIKEYHKSYIGWLDDHIYIRKDKKPLKCKYHSSRYSIYLGDGIWRCCICGTTIKYPRKKKNVQTHK